MDVHVSGILGNDPLDATGGSLYGDTIRFRSEHGLPDRYLVLQPDDEAPYCFDTSDRSGKLTVVCYELFSGHAKVIAESFEQWLRDFVLP